MTVERPITLRPHPYELERSITGDHVVVFSFYEDDVQFEVSGETEHDSLDIDWTNIELDAEDVAELLDGEPWIERCEDPAGRTYKLYVRGGDPDRKGRPIHTEGESA